MSRVHAQPRVSEQIRTLFEAGSLGPLTDGQFLKPISRLRGSARRPRLPRWWSGTDPWSLAVAGDCCSTHTSPKTPSKPPFWCWRDEPDRFENRDSLGGWLHRVARRVALRLRSTSEHRKAREQPASNHEAVAVDHADRLAHDELRSVVDQEIDQLRESHRLPVVLCCLEGISHEEAAQRLRWPLGTVKSRLARGRKRLQERLLRKGFAPSAAIAAAGTSLLGGEACAAVPPALLDATSRAAAAIATESSLAGVIPASVDAVVRKELGTMFASRVKLAIGVPLLTAGATAVILGLVLSGAASQRGQAGPAMAAAVPAINPKARATRLPWRSGSRRVALSSMKKAGPSLGPA